MLMESSLDVLEGKAEKHLGDLCPDTASQGKGWNLS